MRILRNDPNGVTFVNDDYDGEEVTFVLYWNRYSERFLSGFNTVGNTLTLVDDPTFWGAHSFPAAKKLAEEFFRISGGSK